MAINGIVTSDKLQDALFQREILQDILHQAQGFGRLNVDGIVRRAQVTGTKCSLTTMDAVTVSEDLDELVASPIKTPEFGDIAVDLKAQEVKVAFSYESMMNSTIADPLELSRQDAALGFAATLDKKIAKALNTTPMTGTALNVTSKSPYLAVAEAAGKFGNYELTGIAGGQTAIGYLMAGLTSGSGRSNGYDVRDGVARLLGYDVPIAVSSALEAEASGYLFFTSTRVPSAYVLEGQYRTSVYDDHDHRAWILQADVWNAVKSNIRQNSSNLNMGVVKTQLTTS